MTNNLYIMTRIFRNPDTYSTSVENVYAVAPAASPYTPFELCLDVFPTWNYFQMSKELVASGVPLETGLYNPEEVREYYVEERRGVLFISV